MEFWTPFAGLISIHAPQWGATSGYDAQVSGSIISIHAPQWGATPLLGFLRFDFGISIHAPQWGATPAISAKCAEIQFQSTHPSGVRRTGQQQLPRVRRISIHAPQWGATVTPSLSFRSSMDFNPRTPVGCDGKPGKSRKAPKIFQSTHPSGVRRTISQDTARVTYFNPRTPVGCDDNTQNHHSSQQKFQSTHPSGVRPCPRPWSSPARSYFNPRTPVGCDIRRKPKPCPTNEFQSTHPSGVRLSSDVL